MDTYQIVSRISKSCKSSPTKILKHLHATVEPTSVLWSSRSDVLCWMLISAVFAMHFKILTGLTFWIIVVSRPMCFDMIFSILAYELHANFLPFFFLYNSALAVDKIFLTFRLNVDITILYMVVSTTCLMVLCALTHCILGFSGWILLF